MPLRVICSSLIFWITTRSNTIFRRFIPVVTRLEVILSIYHSTDHYIMFRVCIKTLLLQHVTADSNCNCVASFQLLLFSLDRLHKIVLGRKASFFIDRGTGSGRRWVVWRSDSHNAAAKGKTHRNWQKGTNLVQLLCTSVYVLNLTSYSLSD